MIERESKFCEKCRLFTAHHNNVCLSCQDLDDTPQSLTALIERILHTNATHNGKILVSRDELFTLLSLAEKADKS